MPKGHKEGCQCVICRRTDVVLKIPSFSIGQQVKVIGHVKDIPIGTTVMVDGMSTPRGMYKIIFRNRRCWVDENLIKE